MPRYVNYDIRNSIGPLNRIIYKKNTSLIDPLEYVLCPASAGLFSCARTALARMLPRVMGGLANKVGGS
jgi:hypothetical protein